MSLELTCQLIPDPDGYKGALLLKGDWLYVTLTDGKVTGIGEASHSGNDQKCILLLQELFKRHIEGSTITLENITALEAGPLAKADNFLEATAISGLNQCLYDFIARQQGVPVWQLFIDHPVSYGLPAYVTINRALTTRTLEDYKNTIQHVNLQGFNQIKCAPFEGVTPESDQVKAASSGIRTLETIRENFPTLDIRVDFHRRFNYDSFNAILPTLNNYQLHWIEEPCQISPCYRKIRQRINCQLAGGEFYFGLSQFEQLARESWVDVIMPDIKHVGGFGPLLQACRMAASYHVEVSPHNPSGLVSTLASLHAGAISPSATSLEVAWPSSSHQPRYNILQEGEYLKLPEGPGWGLEVDEIFKVQEGYL